MVRHRCESSIAVPDSEDYVDVLLDEWDTHIAECEAALREAAQARRDLDRVWELIARIEAETVRAAAGRTRAERRAAIVLTLERHAGWCDHRRARRAARQRLQEAECRATVARLRAELVRTALTAALGREGGALRRLSEEDGRP